MHWRNRLLGAGARAKMVLGAVLLVAGSFALTGFDKRLETLPVNATPTWLTSLTTHFPKGGCPRCFHFSKFQMYAPTRWGIAVELKGRKGLAMHPASTIMPFDACMVVYGCTKCWERLRPKPGDCCVFCS